MNGLTAQSLAMVLANLNMIAVGLAFGWSSPSLSKYVSEDAEVQLTSSEFGWLASTMNIGCVFGQIAIVFIVDRIGRKWSLYVAAFPEFVAWVMIALAKNFAVLCTARFILGLGVGAIYVILPMYSGELSENRIRGALGSLMNAMNNCGFLIAFSIGPWIPSWALATASAVPLLLFAVTFIWIPDTPYFHLMKGNREAAHSSLMWFRKSNDVDEELKEIEQNVWFDQQNKASIFELVLNLGNRRALIVMFAMVFTQQLSGVNAIQAYATSIFELSGLNFSSDIAVIITGVDKLLAGFFVVFTVDGFGRRPILLLSATVTAVSLAIIAIFYHLQELGQDVSNVSWLPLFGVLLFYLSYTVGLGCVPYAILSEIFPTNVKAWANMVVSVFGSICGWAVTKLYQVIADAFGSYVAFYGFMVCVALGGTFIYFRLPETKQISLRDIQDKLNGRSGSTAKILEDSIEASPK